MKILPVIMGLIAGLLFGIATPLSKLTLSHLSTFQLAGLLYIGAAITFLPYIVRNRTNQIYVLTRIGKAKYLIGIIVFGGLLGPLFLMVGLRAANSTSVSIWLNTELVATAILGSLIFKDHLGRYAIMGVLLTLIASIVISLQETTSGLISGLFVICACICWGIDNHLTAIIDGVTPQTTTFVKGLVGGFVNLLIGLFISGWKIQIEYIGIALLIGIVSYGISIFLYVTSAQNLGATRSQILFSSAPFWGILGASFILSEPINHITIFAVIFLVAGILFSNISSHTHNHVHHKMIHIHMHSHDDGHHDHTHSYLTGRTKKHSHLHDHEDLEHSHSHYPDMHHRHTHEKQS